MMQLECSNGFTLKVDGENLLIISRRGTEAIPISKIQSLKVREPHGLMGFGNFTFSIAKAPVGGIGLGFGITASIGSEQNYFFKDYETAKKMQQYILSYEERQKAPVAESVTDTTDELRKYKQLLDDGIISEDEFATVKKRLLGL